MRIRMQHIPFAKHDTVMDANAIFATAYVIRGRTIGLQAST